MLLPVLSRFRYCFYDEPHAGSALRGGRVSQPVDLIELRHGLLAHSAQRELGHDLRDCAARPHGLGLRHGRSRPIALGF